jgi:hypothetical protein
MVCGASVQHSLQFDIHESSDGALLLRPCPSFIAVQSFEIGYGIFEALVFVALRGGDRVHKAPDTR